MRTSDTIKLVSEALLEAQRTMGDATKGSKNPFFKSSYADLNAIREVAIPALNKAGVSLLQPTVVVDCKNYVETVLLHESGEWISGTTEIKNTKGDAQGEGSGISYARRYGLQSLLSIGAVDDDGEAAQGRTNEKVVEKPNTNTGRTVEPSPVKQARAVDIPNSSVATDGAKGRTETQGVVQSGKESSKEIIGAAFKTLQAQGKETAETFKNTILNGVALSKLDPIQIEKAYKAITTKYPELGL